jgi:hypothetical protein
MTTSEVSDDPFVEHLRRDPLPNAGIRIILLTQLPTESAEAISAPLANLVSALGRPVECSVVPVGDEGVGRALELGLHGATLPLVLVTTAEEPWTKEHLEPLLEAINQCDHVIGCRREWGRGNWTGFLGRLARRIVFAVPLHDIHSPCRLHRLDKLAAIPLQSRSSFLEIEILAKATFLGHLIDEVNVPSLRGRASSSGWLTDVNQVLGHPRFVHSSGPSEESQCEREGDDDPGGEDQHGLANVEQSRSVQDHLAQGTHELRERQGLDERLGGGGKSLIGKEHAREEPHRQHDHVHQPANRLGSSGTAGDQQTDSGEGERTQHVDADDQGQAAPDRHLEHEGPEKEQDREVGDHEREPSRQEREQKVAPGHGRGDEPLEQLRDAKIDQQKADTPEAAPHGVEPDQARDQEVDIA